MRTTKEKTVEQTPSSAQSYSLSFCLTFHSIYLFSIVQEGPPGTKARVKPIQEALITHVCFTASFPIASHTHPHGYKHSSTVSFSLEALMTDTVRNALNPTRLGCITLKGLKTLLWYHCLSPAACASTDSLKSYILIVTQKYDKKFTVINTYII